MGLLLNSEINQKVDQYIQGQVARIGGSVDQILNYKNCKVTDINVKDGGYGEVLTGKDTQTLAAMFQTYKKLLRQEILWVWKGNRIQRDRKTILLDMHFALGNKTIHRKFDSSISSNVIEHSPNPVYLLLNFYFITKENGYQFHAIPNYRYTFDKFREPTKVEHLFDDFEKMTWFDDTTHNEDYIASAIEKHGWQKPFHEKYPVAYPYMHFHVFDENNVRELAECIFEDVTVDVIRNDKFGDNLLLFRNQLNPTFIEKYSMKIEEYSKFIQSLSH
jgi:hypothetical protein